MWIEIKRQKGKEEKINVSREDYVRPQISLKKKKKSERAEMGNKRCREEAKDPKSGFF